MSTRHHTPSRSRCCEEKREKLKRGLEAEAAVKAEVEVEVKYHLQKQQQKEEKHYKVNKVD